MRLLDLPARIASYGVRVVTVRGWEQRGAATFTPRGLVVHHDALRSTIPAGSAIGLMVNGRPDLPGPLCQVWLDDDADDTAVKGDPVAYVIASGRANHAGSGSFRGLIGNVAVVGIEARNNGIGEAWSMAMQDAYYRTSAAVCDAIGRDGTWVCGHKEWTARKPDPRGLDMARFRAAVLLHQLAARRPPASPQPVPHPTTPPAPTMPAHPLTGASGDDPVFFIRNPRNPVELYLTNGLVKRHVRNGPLAEKVRSFTAAQSGGVDAMGPVDVTHAEFDEIPTIGG